MAKKASKKSTGGMRPGHAVSTATRIASGVMRSATPTGMVTAAAKQGAKRGVAQAKSLASNRANASKKPTTTGKRVSSTSVGGQAAVDNRGMLGKAARDLNGRKANIDKAVNNAAPPRRSSKKS